MSFLKNLFQSKAKANVGSDAVKSAGTLSGGKVNAASFLEAVEKGDLEKVNGLLKSLPALVSVKESGGWGETALHKAVGEGNTEMVKLLLASNADVNAQDANHQSPLFDAVNKNHEEIVRLLLARKADVNSRNCQGDFAPLHTAKSRAVAELLIANGANVHATTDKDAGSATPLHKAAQNGRCEVAETLIAHGAKVNDRGEWGSTPLHCAVMENKKDVVQLLLASKSDPNVRDNQGRTILDLAKGHSDLIEVLERHGVSPTTTSRQNDQLNRIDTNGIFWAKTGEVTIQGVNRSLVTIVRFYNDKSVGINTFAEDVIPTDTVHRINRFFRSDCNFLGPFQVNGTDLAFSVTNDHNSVIKKSQGTQTCTGAGKIENHAHLRLKLNYPQMISSYRPFVPEGEFTFQFHAVSFGKEDR